MVLYSPERKGRREEVEDKNCLLEKKRERSYYLLSGNKELAAICLDSRRAASWGTFEVITPGAPTGNT